MRRKVVFFNPPVLSETAPTPGGGGVVNVSMNGIDWQASPTMPSGWQEYREKDSGNPSGFLLYDDDTTSAYKVEIVTTGTGRDGQTTGDDSGVVPDGPLSKCFGFTTGGLRDGFKFTGLDNGMTYQLELVPSYTNTWNWIVSYTIQGTEQNMVADQNTSNSLTFTGVSPISDEILVEMACTNGWSIVNAVILTEE